MDNTSSPSKHLDPYSRGEKFVGEGSKLDGEYPSFTCGSFGWLKPRYVDMYR